MFGAGQTTNTDGAFVKMVANIFAKGVKGRQHLVRSRVKPWPREA